MLHFCVKKCCWFLIWDEVLLCNLWLGLLYRLSVCCGFVVQHAVRRVVQQSIRHSRDNASTRPRLVAQQGRIVVTQPPPPPPPHTLASRGWTCSFSHQRSHRRDSSRRRLIRLVRQIHNKSKQVDFGPWCVAIALFKARLRPSTYADDSSWTHAFRRRNCCSLVTSIALLSSLGWHKLPGCCCCCCCWLHAQVSCAVPTEDDDDDDDDTVHGVDCVVTVNDEFN